MDLHVLVWSADLWAAGTIECTVGLCSFIICRMKDELRFFLQLTKLLRRPALIQVEVRVWGKDSGVTGTWLGCEWGWWGHRFWSDKRHRPLEEGQSPSQQWGAMSILCPRDLVLPILAWDFFSSHSTSTSRRTGDSHGQSWGLSVILLLIFVLQPVKTLEAFFPAAFGSGKLGWFWDSSLKFSV